MKRPLQECLWPPQVTTKSPAQMYVRHCSDKILDPRTLPKQEHGRWAETLVKELFVVSGWEILYKRFRAKGFELDLVAACPHSKEARIIEIKSRSSTQSIDLAAAENLLTYRKIMSLKRGVCAIQQKEALQGRHYYWSFDIVMVTPFYVPDRHLITTWVRALDLSS